MILPFPLFRFWLWRGSRWLLFWRSGGASPGLVSAVDVILKRAPQSGDRLSEFCYHVLDVKDGFVKFGFGHFGHLGAGLPKTGQKVRNLLAQPFRCLHKIPFQRYSVIPEGGDFAAQAHHVSCNVIHIEQAFLGFKIGLRHLPASRIIGEMTDYKTFEERNAVG